MGDRDPPILRPLDHPDLWDYVTHLTGRPRDPDDEPDDLSAQERLESILQHRLIRSSRPYGVPEPVVCFTESTENGIAYLIDNKGYEPWGIVFHKEVAYAKGAAPVHYVRGDEWQEVCRLPNFRARAVPFRPGESEWMHEREWRSVHTENDGFAFTAENVVAVITGRADWPDPEPVWGIDGRGDPDWYLEYPDWAKSIPRWLWNDERGEFLEYG